MSNPIIKIVRDFIKTCPHLPEYYKGIGVNYLSDQTDTYVIESVPAEEIIDGYTDGSTTRQFVFLFASKEPYGEDVLSNIDNPDRNKKNRHINFLDGLKKKQCSGSYRNSEKDG